MGERIARRGRGREEDEKTRGREDEEGARGEREGEGQKGDEGEEYGRKMETIKKNNHEPQV
jgi:hypothetical protein